LPARLFLGQSERLQACGLLFDGATSGFIVRHRLGTFPSLKLLFLEPCFRPMAGRLGIAHESRLLFGKLDSNLKPDSTDEAAN
jgi:hypothetical protein